MFRAAAAPLGGVAKKSLKTEAEGEAAVDVDGRLGSLYLDGFSRWRVQAEIYSSFSSIVMRASAAVSSS